MFISLYESWSHNPVATVSLCLLTQNYAHACDLVKALYPLTILYVLRTTVYYGKSYIRLYNVRLYQKSQRFFFFGEEEKWQYIL